MNKYQAAVFTQASVLLRSQSLLSGIYKKWKGRQSSIHHLQINNL